MTPEEMQIAIAEMCGWVEVDCIKWKGDQKDPPKQFMRGCGHLPDYLNDLNAMNEAVMAQPQEVRYKINHELFEMLRPEEHSILDRAVNATAAQRAEAFCRTLWPERFLTNPRAAEGTPDNAARVSLSESAE